MSSVIGKNFNATGLALTCGSVSLAISPWMNLDPINLPKLLILVLGSFVLAGFLIPQIHKLDKVTLMICSLFLLAMIFSMTLSEKSLVEQFYGTYGRNTGFLTYLALTILFLVGVNFFSLDMARYLLIALLATGIVNLGYGYIQWFGFDPINWNNKYNPIIGTLGNPNFLSSHLGFAALIAASFLFSKKLRFEFRGLYALFILLALALIYQSDSIQGIAVFAIGLFLIIYFRYFRLKRVLAGLYLITGLIGMILGLLGTLQIGPLTRFLYQDSVTYRGDYWRAGIEIARNNPFFGAGLDSYGDWYRFSRSIEATDRRGPEIVSNSAHNVFIDVASSGGIILLGIYLILFGFVVKSIFKILSNQKNYDVFSVGLIVVWLSYVIQSVISINQIGLAVWGWALGGAIVGYAYSFGQPAVKQNKNQDQNLATKFYSPAVILGLIGLVLAILPLTKDANFRKSLTSGSIAQLERAAFSFPVTTFHLDFASSGLFNNELYEQSLAFAQDSVEINPRNFDGWLRIFNSPAANLSQKKEALRMLRGLDPNNPNLFR